MDDYTKSASAFTADNGYFWLILGISILTPISEELIFRGVIQGELRRAMPEWAAIVIQAVLFAAYHMQPIQSSYVLLPGLLLGLAYYWSRSIWVPIAMHCLFNFLGSALPSLIGESKLGQEILGYSEMGFILIGAAAAVFFMLHRRRPAASDLGEMKI
jgi:membrane protease YdiL (CAAX protease family)